MSIAVSAQPGGLPRQLVPPDVTAWCAALALLQLRGSLTSRKLPGSLDVGFLEAGDHAERHQCAVLGAADHDLARVSSPTPRAPSCLRRPAGLASAPALPQTTDVRVVAICGALNPGGVVARVDEDVVVAAGRVAAVLRRVEDHVPERVGVTGASAGAQLGRSLDGTGFGSRLDSVVRPGTVEHLDLVLRRRGRDLG